MGQAFDRLEFTPFRYKRKMIVERQGKEYLAYCSVCNEYHRYTAEEMRQIRASRICPQCHTEISLGRRKYMDAYGYVLTTEFGREEGYYVFNSIQFPGPPKSKMTLVAKFCGNNVDVRFIRCNMGSSFTFRIERYEWKTIRGGADRYAWRMAKVADPILMSRREYYEDCLKKLGKPDLKSSQAYMIRHSLMSWRQMALVIMFDLKSMDEVLKYSGYANRMGSFIPHRSDFMKRLNISHLDYISRNRIPLRSYLDYASQCSQLGMKLDKPKDFAKAHERLSIELKVRDMQEHDLEIAEFSRTLEPNAYRKGKISIEPFRNCREIVDCAAVLHNCIASIYLPRYAKGNTELYHLDVDGKLEIAIERKNGRIAQAYGAYNTECPKDLRRTIERWNAKLETSSIAGNNIC